MQLHEYGKLDIAKYFNFWTLGLFLSHFKIEGKNKKRSLVKPKYEIKKQKKKKRLREQYNFSWYVWAPLLPNLIAVNFSRQLYSNIFTRVCRKLLTYPAKSSPACHWTCFLPANERIRPGSLDEHTSPPFIPLWPYLLSLHMT